MQPTPVVSTNGLVTATPLSITLQREEEARQVQEQQAQPFITGLAGHVAARYEEARTARRGATTIEQRMLESMRARRGEYTPEMLAEIKAVGSSEIYSNLTSVKCRAAGSWIRDVLVATGTERPWTIRPTPVPALPADINEQIVQTIGQSLMAMQQSGQVQPTDQTLIQLMEATRDQTRAAIVEEARDRAERMADKMEDQLVEGGFLQALNDFIDDIVTFPTAVLKGPVMRNKKTLTWQAGPDGAMTPVLTDEIKMEWERVSPFDIYPSPAATGVQDGFIVEVHRLSRQALNELIGVEGYDDAAIRAALQDYEDGLHTLLDNRATIAAAEGKSTTLISTNHDGLIEALEYWGSVSGQTLLDWGLTEEEVPEPTKEYPVQCWVVGAYVIKAVLNYDPLARKPYYTASYETVPGNFWGNSVCDLLRDVQSVTNAAARAIVNNMAIASGPQVVVDISRLPPGEEVTNLVPWRVWQVASDQSMPGNGAMPISFFQPDSRVQELMQVFSMFQDLADDYSGLPKYMAGANAGGAGRTASGMSMLMSNAGKAIKQVINNIDMGVMTPLLERLYHHNMQFSEDADLKGDIQIVARGANSLIAKEAAQQAQVAFMQMTANPLDMQIIGIEGRHSLLRAQVKTIGLDADRIVPPLDVFRKKLAAMQAASMPQQGSPAAPPDSGQALADGAPVTDNFSPQPSPPQGGPPQGAPPQGG